MNILHSRNPVRMIAFFLVAVMLVCTFGFTVDGWTLANESGDNGNFPDRKPTSAPPDVTPPDNDISEEDEIVIPKYTSYLTGLEIDEEMANTRALALVLNPDASLYGISSAELAIEVPIENGKTRLLAFINSISGLGKIGAFAPSRAYISNLAYFFNSTLISYGNDDNISYESVLGDGDGFDFTEHSGYHYSEFEKFQYTNQDLLSAALKNAGISTVKKDSPMPYSFNEFGKSEIYYETSAEEISILFSESSSSELVYSSVNSEYLFMKNNEQKKDTINSKSIYYKNCLVLFADSVTYENSNGEQMVINTLGEGSGYYFTNGTVTNITWSSGKNGKMNILSQNGSPLAINRGRTYVSFMKSSRTNSVSFK